MKLIYVLTLPLIFTSTQFAWSDAKPPKDAKPLSEIARDLEFGGFSPITEISYDHGEWEVEGYRNGDKRELKVDPVSGKIKSDRPEN
jgi:hypothetical protein